MGFGIIEDVRLDAQNPVNGPQIGVFARVHPGILTRFGILVVGNLIDPNLAYSRNTDDFTARK